MPIVLQRSLAADRRTYDICLIVCAALQIGFVLLECSSGAKLLTISCAVLLAATAEAHHA